MKSRSLKQNIKDWVALNSDDVNYQCALDIILNYGVVLNNAELDSLIKKIKPKGVIRVCVQEQLPTVRVDPYRIKNYYWTLTDPYN